MKKYFVIKQDTKTTDEDWTWCQSKKEAIDAAQSEWDRLCDQDKRRNYISACVCELHGQIEKDEPMEMLICEAGYDSLWESPTLK